jgi:hypothetical protein
MDTLEFGNATELCEVKNPKTNASMHTIINHYFKKYDNSDKQCKPIPACNRDIYEASFELEDQKVGTNNSFLRIQLASPNVQYIEDSISYDAQSLIGEVGGTLGLLLGLSVMSIFDLIYSLLN